MPSELFDAIVVGAGQAGPAIAARCSNEGLRTAVIERGHFGGTCVNVGCVPSAGNQPAIVGSHVQMNEDDAREAMAQGRKVLRAAMPMRSVGRAREAGETPGFMKVLVNADSKLLMGASILGMNGDEVVHGLLDSMTAKQPYSVISRAMPIHPTVSELIPTLLQQLEPLV